MDAIQLIRRDHRDIDGLFTRFERAERDGNLGEQGRVAREILRELSVHAVVEEQFLYPALREAGVGDEVLNALEEHHLVKVTLAELEALDPRDERFAPKLKLVVANVREHVEEEERELLPRLQGALDAAQLRQLGDTLASAKRIAPTRPHPAAPDTPPGNFVAGAFAAFVDRSLDAIRGGAEMLLLVAERGARRGGETARTIARRAAGRGRRAVGQARTQGLAVAEEAAVALDDLVEVGAGAVDDVRERGREAVVDLRKRRREMAAVAGEHGEEGARRVKESGREAAREVRATGRAATRGYEGEPHPAPTAAPAPKRKATPRPARRQSAARGRRRAGTRATKRS